jgi:hypothetical protein
MSIDWSHHIDMSKKISVVIFIFFQTISFVLAENISHEKKEWFVCTSNEDCVEDFHFCNGINKKYVNEMEAYYRQIKQNSFFLDCKEKFSSRPKIIKMICENNQCKIRNELENWYKCQEDTDCVSYQPPCEPSYAVNKIYQKEAAKYGMEHDFKMYQCLGKEKDKPTVACLNYECQIKNQHN